MFKIPLLDSFSFDLNGTNNVFFHGLKFDSVYTGSEKVIVLKQ